MCKKRRTVCPPVPMKTIKTTAPAPEWVQLAEDRGFTCGTGKSEYGGLKSKLLGIGGWAVCLPRSEPDLKKIMSRGRTFQMKATLLRGEPCQCHFNSSVYWGDHSRECSICTGYALSKDGMWRQHTWVLRVEGRIVETTHRRLCYFGYVLSPSECREFAASNF